MTYNITACNLWYLTHEQSVLRISVRITACNHNRRIGNRCQTRAGQSVQSIQPPSSLNLNVRNAKLQCFSFVNAQCSINWHLAFIWKPLNYTRQACSSHWNLDLWIGRRPCYLHYTSELSIFQFHPSLNVCNELNTHSLKVPMLGYCIELHAPIDFNI